MERLSSLWRRSLDAIEHVSWLGPLAARLSIGALFLATGWGKLHSLEKVASFFQELGIPAPAFNAHLVAVTEFAGGLALLVGFATRLASIPLAITMTVAILTAKLGDVDGVLSLLALEEFTYFAILVWLIVAGPGAASLDALIARRVGRSKESTSIRSSGGPALSEG